MVWMYWEKTNLDTRWNDKLDKEKLRNDQEQYKVKMYGEVKKTPNGNKASAVTAPSDRTKSQW